MDHGFLAPLAYLCSTSSSEIKKGPQYPKQNTIEVYSNFSTVYWLVKGSLGWEGNIKGNIEIKFVSLIALGDLVS